jgi:hypothetical protein
MNNELAIDEPNSAASLGSAAPPPEELAPDGLPVTLPNGFTRRQIAEAISPRIQELILLPTEKCNFRCTYCYEDFDLGKMSEETQRTVMPHGMNQPCTSELFCGNPWLSPRGQVTSDCLTMHLPKGMNMKLTSVKKSLVAFVGTIIFSSLGTFHGTASAQVPFVEGINVTAPPWNCREDFVDWMGAGGGYFMTICDSWDFSPPRVSGWDFTRPPYGGGGGGGVGGGGASPPAPRSEEEFIRHFKRTANLCKKSTENCDAWGQRIGLDYCANVRPSAFISACHNAHLRQTAVGCPDVACP